MAIKLVVRNLPVSLPLRLLFPGKLIGNIGQVVD